VVAILESLLKRKAERALRPLSLRICGMSRERYF
jgi:hypothetical protein